MSYVGKFVYNSSIHDRPYLIIAVIGDMYYCLKDAPISGYRYGNIDIIVAVNAKATAFYVLNYSKHTGDIVSEREYIYNSYDEALLVDE